MKKRRLALAALISTLLLLVSSVAGFAAPATGPAASDACAELIKNGNFEAGSANWTQEGASNLVTTFNPYTGRYSAQLGGANNANHRIRQHITVPANEAVSLRFWWEQWTQETAPGTSDYLAVNVLNSNGGLIKEMARLGVDPDAPPWAQLTFGLTGYAGQTVQIQFQAVTDATNPTDFFVDDVSVTACTARHSYLPLIRR